MSRSVELLRIEGGRKSFPGVVALDGVDFDLRSGQAHALLGENGAGRSTLIKTLSGAYRTGGGTVCAEGERVRINGTEDAERLGIATVYQEFDLVPDLTVAENDETARRGQGTRWQGGHQRAGRRLRRHPRRSEGGRGGHPVRLRRPAAEGTGRDRRTERGEDRGREEDQGRGEGAGQGRHPGERRRLLLTPLPSRKAVQNHA
ncbi:ATP-binding cassette domain-containing protein [Streptomyces sp. NBC_01754]|uniref:ATP-binding cassette domain-containing protein n=1 Tax=Streptomyces sp. NBC_01754 TaxID=2975930 RepID=UPI002DD95F7B|nr:ATP-binding cassette domain-containing protein [Streptomyces sp. NBC_01754]WSC95973.1 ATP-binding cassette domain-containing protein [Streptomyces sp. NBC_01754]